MYETHSNDELKETVVTECYIIRSTGSCTSQPGLQREVKDSADSQPINHINHFSQVTSQKRVVITSGWDER
ncbi:hypothetical protein M513_11318 [Trichuris suis]|uniref:Uncharacterized protein n=1 Tax=Trichuris suis TaxID=68888 RepID=A0A085LS92_9BILA|nr:hypothetical protein M513_11318 [Trichuris suis]